MNITRLDRHGRAVESSARQAWSALPPYSLTEDALERVLVTALRQRGLPCRRQVEVPSLAVIDGVTVRLAPLRADVLCGHGRGRILELKVVPVMPTLANMVSMVRVWGEQVLTYDRILRPVCVRDRVAGLVVVAAREGRTVWVEAIARQAAPACPTGWRNEERYVQWIQRRLEIRREREGIAPPPRPAPARASGTWAALGRFTKAHR